LGAAAGKPDSVKPDSLARPTPTRGWLRSAGRGSGSGGERGATLQTLIITAVLVLLAVAAGVVIVAITGSSSDDLEDQASDIEGRCLPWEIHDPELEAAGLGGGDIDAGEGGDGVASSRIGCLAPCYLGVLAEKNDFRREELGPLNQARQQLADFVIGSDDTIGPMNLPASTMNFPTRLVFDTSNRQTQQDRPNQNLNVNTDVLFEIRLMDKNLGESFSNYAVRVTASQDGCVIYNTETEAICVDSRRPERQQLTGLC